MIFAEDYIYEGNLIRVCDIDDELWFVAQDIAEVLNHKSASKMCSIIYDDEKMIKMLRSENIPNARNMLIISHSAALQLSMCGEFHNWLQEKFGTYKEPEAITVTKDNMDFKTASEFICAIVDVGLKFNVPKDILFSESVKLAMNLTGHDFTNILELSPHYNNEEYYLC